MGIQEGIRFNTMGLVRNHMTHALFPDILDNGFFAPEGGGRRLAVGKLVMILDNWLGHRHTTACLSTI